MDLKTLLGLRKEDVLAEAKAEAERAATESAQTGLRRVEEHVVGIERALNDARSLPPIVTDGLVAQAERVFVQEYEVPEVNSDGGAVMFSPPCVNSIRASGSYRVSLEHVTFGRSEFDGPHYRWKHKRYKVVLAFLPCED